MTRLNQVLALEADAKRHAVSAMAYATGLLLGKAEALKGEARTWEPRDDPKEGGEVKPSTEVKVQATAEEIVAALRRELTKLFDLSATKDWANTEARADITVNGKPLLPQVPTTYLLFLKTQLAELEGFIGRLPVLDPTVHWDWEASKAQSYFVSQPVWSTSNKKQKVKMSLAAATKEHPEQVITFDEDVPVGRWNVITYSGAITAPRKEQLQERIRALQAAVKIALEEANTRQVTEQKVGDPIFGYLFS